MLKGYNFKYAALQGGGAKGEGHVGVLRGLQRLGLYENFDTISGASAGAISALLYATGWSIEKVEAFTKDLNLSTLAMGGMWDRVKIPYTELNYYGFFNADAFYQLFKQVIKTVSGNENCTFRQWHELREKKPELKDTSVQAFNDNTKKNETFAWNTAHADVPMADAFRASMAFPVFFTPWPIGTFTYQEKGVQKTAPLYYSDGGIQKNCPYDVFEKTPGKYNRHVLSVKLESFEDIKYFQKGIPPQPKTVKSFAQCHMAQFEGALGAQEALFKSSPYLEHAVFVDTLNVDTLDFDLTQEQKEALHASGEYAVIRFFYQLDPKLVESKYDEETIRIFKEANWPLCFSELMQNHAVPEEVLNSEPKPSKEPATSVKSKTLPENVVSIDEHRNKSVTPMFHKWCRNRSLRDECSRLTALAEKHGYKDDKPKSGHSIKAC